MLSAITGKYAIRIDIQTANGLSQFLTPNTMNTFKLAPQMGTGQVIFHAVVAYSLINGFIRFL